MFIVYHTGEVELKEYDIVDHPGMRPSENGDCIIKDKATGHHYTGNRSKLSDTKEEAIQRALETQQKYVQQTRERLAREEAILAKIRSLT